MNLFYREYGNGKPIIIAHGLFGMSDNWLRVAKLLSKTYKVYLLDMRNHGQSPNSKEHTYNAMSLDFIKFLKKKEIKKAIFIGHSMGGKAVLQFSTKFPEKVEQMIIVDISTKKNKHDTIFLKYALNHQEILKIIINSNISTLKNRKEINNYFLKFFNDAFVLQLLQKNICRNEQKQFSWKINPNILFSNLHEISKEILISEKAKQIKSLFIFGSKSPYFRKEDKELIYSTFYNAKIKIIKDAGHLIHIEKEKEFVQTVMKFIKTQT